MTWRERWAEKIYEIHMTLPNEATLDDRIKAIKPLTPTQGEPFWSKKSWQNARRDYLKKYGYVSKHGKKNSKSPMDRIWN